LSGERHARPLRGLSKGSQDELEAADRLERRWQGAQLPQRAGRLCRDDALDAALALEACLRFATLYERLAWFTPRRILIFRTTNLKNWMILLFMRERSRLVNSISPS
jgi:hypothetical protein